MMVKLNELVQAIDIVDAFHMKELDVSGIAYHSGKVKPGDVFVCIRGLLADGHKYLASAVSKGAVAAIVEEYQADIDIPQYVVANSRIAMARLAASFYSQPSKQLKMIGITATNGKTTTSFMLNAILEHAKLKTGLIGTVSVKIVDEYIPSELTTPESLDLQNFLKQMVDKQVTHVNMEVSSAALEAHRVEAVDYDIVTLNNISREHIDHHDTFEKYYETKTDFIRHSSPDSFAVLNLDDPYVAPLVSETRAQPITFSLKDDSAHILCKDLDLSTGRAKFTVQLMKPLVAQTQRGHSDNLPEFRIELDVPGLHSVYNAMIAISVALLCDIPIDVIQQGIKAFKGVERRFQFIYEQDYIVIDDHYANVGNINVTMQTLEHMHFDTLHLVYAIRGSRGKTVNKENAETIASWASKLGIQEIIATTSVSHVTKKDWVTAEELSVFQQVMEEAHIKVHLYDELPEAIAHAKTRVKPNDVILLAGCQGMDHGAQIFMEQI